MLNNLMIMTTLLLIVPLILEFVFFAEETEN